MNILDIKEKQEVAFKKRVTTKYKKNSLTQGRFELLQNIISLI